MQFDSANKPMTEIFLDATDWQLLAQLQADASLSNQALAAAVGVSPATALRRVRRLHEAGLIERQVALLSADRLGALVGHGLLALAEVWLQQQDAQSLDAFEALAVAEDAVQQCYRVSPGPDFVLVLALRDMPAYHQLAQRLFQAQAHVRNVKTYFSVKRAKFHTQLPLPAAQ